MKKLLLLVLLFSITLQAKIYNEKITNFKVLSVYDGDTFYIKINNTYNVFGDNIAVRIRGIDAPELNNQNKKLKRLALKSKKELERLLRNGKKIKLYNVGRDKYFRLLASVEVDGVDVANYLIKKGLAKRYSGGTKNW